MLFPDVDLVGTRTRDRWLIKNYCPPTAGEVTFKNQPASLLPGGVTFVTGFQQAGTSGRKSPAPKELIVDVNDAYFRLLRKEVSLWFTDFGFDVTKPTISKTALLETGLSPEARVEI